MQEILEEQGFQQSGCVTDECVVEVGQMLGAQQMVGGSIGRLGNVFTITARVIDVESGEIINVTTYDHEGDIGSLLKTGMRQVALDLFSKQEVASVSAVINTGDLFIVTDPEGAEFIVDNRKMGYTPILIEKLGIGDHQIQIKLKGYLSQSHDITILTDRVDSLTVTMVTLESIQNELIAYKKYEDLFTVLGASLIPAGLLLEDLAINPFIKYSCSSTLIIGGILSFSAAIYYYYYRLKIVKKIEHNS
ncbi:MAG: PEGA domain-containing protein [Candidatus Marinimicrobia bacterium]|nr:PEGA domain-containing protein [Candidatus Neomarinimicrobiota bacterium]